MPALLRGLWLSLGLAGIIWSVALLPAFWSGATAKAVVARILANDRFKRGTLSEVLASMQATPGPAMWRTDLVRAEALLRLRIADEMVGRKSSEDADLDATAAEDRLKSSLALNPTDSLLWSVLFSLNISGGGFDARAVGFLDQSYATGPFEGGIALRRNRLALAAFPVLPDSIRNRTVAEFRSMVDSEFTEDAALNLMGAGWTHKERLLASLEGVDAVPREALAKRLMRDGVMIKIPGVRLDERFFR
ncbi:hypothetical protein [Bradyrhizobium sp. USDA 223]|uniref:hypothetical protein n=1 Tax=Bradyrhizobium sp. USDA 223 TaxID=3156306 RepID=UPI003850EABB